MAHPDLLAAVEALEPAPYSGEAFRHLAEKYNPLSGAGARTLGGRWNPPDSFSTLYIAVERETAVTEFRRMAQRFGRDPTDFLPRRLYRYEVTLGQLLDVRDPPARERIGLTDDMLASDDLTVCQEIGEAAHLLGCEGVIAPSATGDGTVIAVFFDAVRPQSTISVLDYEMWEAEPE